MAKVYKYFNVSEDYGIINGWRDTNEFPYLRSSIDEQSFLSDIAVTEIQITSNNLDKQLFDESFEKLKNNIASILKCVPLNSFLFCSERKLQVKNRLRSYKGILPKDVNGVVELENSDDGIHTLISGAAYIDVNNTDEIVSYLYNGNISFMISTEERFNTQNNLERIFSKCMSHGSVSIINYIKLLNEYCKGEAIIYRLSGDGGVTHTSLQLFYQKQTSEQIKRIIKLVVT